MGTDTPAKDPPTNKPPTSVATNLSSGSSDPVAPEGDLSNTHTSKEESSAQLATPSVDILPLSNAALPISGSEQAEINLKQNEIYKALYTEYQKMGKLLDDFDESPTVSLCRQLFASITAFEVWSEHIPGLLAKKLTDPDHVTLHSLIRSINRLVVIAESKFKEPAPVSQRWSPYPAGPGTSTLPDPSPANNVHGSVQLGSRHPDAELLQPFIPLQPTMPGPSEGAQALSPEDAHSVLYAHWFSKEILSDLLTFEGGTADYLRWKAVVCLSAPTEGHQRESCNLQLPPPPIERGCCTEGLKNRSYRKGSHRGCFLTLGQAV